MNSTLRPSPSPYPPLPAPPEAAIAGRKRVCIASFDFVGPVKNGGVGTAFTSLGEALAAAGHDVTLLFLAGQWCENRTLPEWIEYYRAKGIRFVPVPDSGLRINGRWHVNKAYEGYLWLKQQDFDVIHFSEWKGTGYFALRAKRQGLAFAHTTLCVHTHGPTLWHKLSNGEYVTEIDDVELDYLERCSVELADVLTSPSQYLLRWMRQRGWTLPARTFVQQYVRPATARAPKPDADRVHRIEELVFFGRLEVRKGLVLFCDALDQLAADPSTHRARITFLGKVDKVDGRDSIAYISDRAAGWPWRCEVINDRDQQGAMDYLQGETRLAVIPSLVDNLPNTVLECLGAQVPFLASDAGGIPEMIAAPDLAATCFPLHAGRFAARLRTALAAGVRPARYAVEQTENERAWVDWHRQPVVVAGPAPAEPTADAVVPLVSVCMSHWNRPAYLRQALASLAAQDHARLEVVLVDDGSTQPEAKALLDALAPDFAARGWQLLRQAENRYPGAARNCAARAARGDFLFFMDDDNLAKPDEVSTLLRVARHTGADIVTCCLDTFSGHEPPRAGARPEQRWLFIGDDVATGAFRNCFGDTNALWRREAFRAAGGFHEDWGVGHEDWELLARAVLRGLRLEVVPEALVWYRYNEREATVNRKTPPQANHLANIRPYLEAMPAGLQTMVSYAQGMHVRRSAGDAGSSTAFIQHTVAWRSAVQAAVVLAHHRQGPAAAQVLLQAVQDLEKCPQPSIVLDALMEIGPRLGLLDGARARTVLEVATKLALMLKRGGDVARIRGMMSDLPSPRTPAEAAAGRGREPAMAGS